MATLRRPCPVVLKRELINKQKNKCGYCGIEFGSYVLYKDKLVKIKVHCDHIIPFIHIQANPRNNWIIVCQFCNAIKGYKVFNSIEEIKEYVKRKDRKKLFSVPKRIQNKPPKENILLPKLPMVSLGQVTSKNKIIKSRRILTRKIEIIEPILNWNELNKRERVNAVLNRFGYDSFMIPNFKKTIYDGLVPYKNGTQK